MDWQQPALELAPHGGQLLGTRGRTSLSCTEKEARCARWNLRKKWGLKVAEGCPRMFLLSWAALWPSEKASLLPQLAVRLISLGRHAAGSAWLARAARLPSPLRRQGTHAAPAGCPPPRFPSVAGAALLYKRLFHTLAVEQVSRKA